MSVAIIACLVGNVKYGIIIRSLAVFVFNTSNGNVLQRRSWDDRINRQKKDPNKVLSGSACFYLQTCIYRCDILAL